MSEIFTETVIEADIPSPPQSSGAMVEARQSAALTHDAPLLAIISRAASDPRVDMDKFERLLAMQEKLELAQERREFNAAMASAKAEIGPVLKNREVDFTSPKGRTNYRYEDFAEVARTVDGPLSKHGLSYRFRATQEGKGGDADPRRVRVTCIVSRGGYSEETELVAFEDHSGNKNSIQAIASTATYLQRATLKLALGLAAGADDDSRAGGKTAPSAISDDQAAEIEALIDETNSETTGMLAYVGAKSIVDMTEAQFLKAKAAMLKKRAKGVAA